MIPTPNPSHEENREIVESIAEGRSQKAEGRKRDEKNFAISGF